MTKRPTARVARLATVVAATTAACLIGAPQSGATFRGANALLVYQAQAGKHIQLFTIGADGSGRRQITHLRGSDALNPEWSPDSRRIVFARDYGFGTRHEHLDIVTLEDVVTALLNAEETEHVRTVIADLPKRDALILRAHFFEQRRPDDLSRELRIKPGYLRVLLHRAKDKFRKSWSRNVTRMHPDETDDDHPSLPD